MHLIFVVVNREFKFQNDLEMLREHVHTNRFRLEN